MKKLFLMVAFLGVFLLQNAIVYACLNYNDNYNYDMRPSHALKPEDYRNLIRAMAKSPKELFEEINKKHQRRIDNNSATQADILQYDALKELLTNDPEQAIKLFLAYEEKYPHSYINAANLGTAYELIGKNKEAIKWIKKGITYNEYSHYNTEWLHVLILETKIKAAEYPGFLYNRSIIELAENLEGIGKKPFGVNEDINSTAELPANLKALETALAYQLEERLIFVKPNDLVVADLLYTYSKIVAHKGDAVTAISLLQLSKAYSYGEWKLYDTTLKSYKNQIFLEALAPIFKTFALIFMVCLTPLIFRMIHKRRAKKNAQGIS